MLSVNGTYKNMFSSNGLLYSVLNILLKDRTTDKNIVWSTDTYEIYNRNCGVDSELQISDVLDLISKDVLVPRSLKSSELQEQRQKERAEVFTPSWVCNKMNNYYDSNWFGRDGVFNTENDNNTWTSTDKVDFGDKSWTDYIDSRCMEVTCGEAPYLVSRYDTVTNSYIQIKDRVGLLDRKLRVINENVDNEAEWLKWVCRAYKAIYGYEYQGDNLFLARVNLLMTFIDYYNDKFCTTPDSAYIKEIAEIVSWNLWQMDGLKDSLNYIPAENMYISDLILGYVEDITIYCKIKDWHRNKVVEFRELKDRAKFFNFSVGNPPYQESRGKTENQTQMTTFWIFHKIARSADKVSGTTCFIYPFGSWFDDVKAIEGFGEELLTDGHTVSIEAFEGSYDKSTWYRMDKAAQPIFEAVSLMVGVCIVLRDNLNIHESYKYSNRVYCDDVVDINREDSDTIVPNPLFIKLGINNKLGDDRLVKHLSKSTFGVDSNFVELNPKLVSFNEKDWEDPVLLITNDKGGSSGRAKRYYIDISNIPKGDYYIDLYKVIICSAYPKCKLVSCSPTISNVKKRITEVVEILPLHSAFGRSRVMLYASERKSECQNLLKYMQTTFFAALVLEEPTKSSSIGYIIPWQDFTDNSDIDWSKSIDKINEQLYRKYNLTESEIAYLERTLE